MGNLENNVSEETVNSWLNNATNVREESIKSQKKASDDMIRRYAKNNPVSEYQVGETILVRNPEIQKRRPKRLLAKAKAFEGLVIERKKDHYKIRYEADDGEYHTSWFSVSDLTSLSKEAENERQSRGCFLNLSKKSVDASRSDEPDRSLLYQRLEDIGLAPVNIAKDGNCFFRAVSHQLYGTSKYHAEVRRQAIDQMTNERDIFENSALYNGNHDDYLAYMSRYGSWADSPLIQATANAFEIDIHIIPSQVDHATLHVIPRNEHSTQSLFLGYVTDNHYISTAPLSQPRSLHYGGRTSSGQTLTNTCPLDGPLTWLINMMLRYKDMNSFVLNTDDQLLSILGDAYNCFKNGDDADAKLTWYSFVKRKSFYNESEISFFGSDAELVFEKLQNSDLGKTKILTEISKCTNNNCNKNDWPLRKRGLVHRPKKSDDFKENIDWLFNGEKQSVPCDTKTGAQVIRCGGLRHERPVIIVQSPFFIVPGDFVKNSTKPIPQCLHIPDKLNPNGSKLQFDLKYINIKATSAGSHFFSIMKFNEKYWYTYDGLDSFYNMKPLVNLPEEYNGKITFLVFVCATLFTRISPQKSSVPSGNKKSPYILSQDPNNDHDKHNHVPKKELNDLTGGINKNKGTDTKYQPTKEDTKKVINEEPKEATKGSPQTNRSAEMRSAQPQQPDTKQKTKAGTVRNTTVKKEQGTDTIGQPQRDDQTTDSSRNKESKRKHKKTAAKIEGGKKQKKVDESSKSIDESFRSLKSTSWVELVQIEQLWKFREFDRRFKKNPRNPPNYLTKLTKEIKKEGLKYPLTLAVSKETSRAYVYEGNHRLRALMDLGFKWAPVRVSSFFLRDHDDKELNVTPFMLKEWPYDPIPSHFGLITKPLPS